MSRRYYPCDRVAQGSSQGAEVWIAWHEANENLQFVLIKAFCICTTSNTTNMLQRCEQEVNCLEIVKNCPGTPTLVESFIRDDQYIIITDFIPGITMRDLIGKLFEARVKHFSRSLLLEVVKKLLVTLSDIHNRGILHLDIKPENIILTGKETKISVTLIDFGISRWMGDELEAYEPRDAPGTPFYMSNEAERGRAFVDNRSDLFSLGMLIYECLSYSFPPKEIQYPFPFTNAFVCKAIHPDAALRFQNADEMLRQLQRKQD